MTRTRKRFIKQVMGMGVSRNKAAEIADFVVLFYHYSQHLKMGQELTLTFWAKSQGIEVTATTTGTEWRVREWGDHGD